jgi:hypothetical protein
MTNLQAHYDHQFATLEPPARELRFPLLMPTAYLCGYQAIVYSPEGRWVRTELNTRKRCRHCKRSP